MIKVSNKQVLQVKGGFDALNKSILPGTVAFQVLKESKTIATSAALVSE